MLNEIYNNQKVHNDKALEALKRDFTTLRTGKVSINILDHVHVDYYGSSTPLNQVATVLATDASTITITPWEKPMLKTIATAIQAANIGVNPNNDGESVKLFFPPMTTEDRQKNAKEAKAMGEAGLKKMGKSAANKFKQSSQNVDQLKDGNKPEK